MVAGWARSRVDNAAMTGQQQFAAGVAVVVTDVDGVDHEAVARSGIEGRSVDGFFTHDFPVVWVDIARRDGRGTVPVPWPLTAIRTASG